MIAVTARDGPFHQASGFGLCMPELRRVSSCLPQLRGFLSQFAVIAALLFKAP
jgi:hypothetical protein